MLGISLSVSKSKKLNPTLGTFLIFGGFSHTSIFEVTTVFNLFSDCFTEKSKYYLESRKQWEFAITYTTNHCINKFLNKDKHGI